MPSMKYFLVKDLPLESSHQFRIWFVDLWNLVLVEEFKKELEGMNLFIFTFLAYIFSIVELKKKEFLNEIKCANWRFKSFKNF